VWVHRAAAASGASISPSGSMQPPPPLILTSERAQIRGAVSRDGGEEGGRAPLPVGEGYSESPAPSPGVGGSSTYQQRVKNEGRSRTIEEGTIEEGTIEEGTIEEGTVLRRTSTQYQRRYGP
jgi:hypothetical protein